MEEKNKTGKRISNVLRYICGVFFILTGFSGMLINNILAGFFYDVIWNIFITSTI